MYKKQTLKNGVRLITVPLKETQTVTLLVLIRAGSRYENKINNGVSHFVEHVMFKGTKKRPNTLALSKELDGIGAEFNAFTSKDYTGYYIKANSRHLELVIDVLSDMLINSKFDAKEIEKEKGVIVEEINMYEDNPLMYVEDLVEEIMYSNSPLGYPISGSREGVKNLSQKELLDYRKKLYQGSNVVIALAGNYDEKIISKIENKFKFPNSSKLNGFKEIKINQKSPRVNLFFKETEQTQIALALPAYSYFSSKIHALHLLSIILGGNMSSRLFLSVREKNGLAYFIRSWLNIYEDTGSLVIQAGLDKSRINKAIKLIISELEKIKKGVKNEELNRAKEYLAGKTSLELEDTSNLSQWYSKSELLTNKIVTPEEKIKKTMKVSKEDVVKVAKEIINLKKINLAVIGPFKDEKEFYKLF